MNGPKSGFLAVVLALASASSTAATYYISSGLGDDGNDGTTMATAFKSLSKVFGDDGVAQTHLAADNTIILSNGTYALDVPLDFFKTVLRGWTGDPKDVILDGQDKTNCCKLASGKNIIADVTVRRGTPALGFINDNFRGGAGIIINQSQSYATNCIIRDCRTPTTCNRVAGGGVAVSSGKIYDCWVENCLAQSTATSDARAYGGGICLYGAGTAAYGCTVTNCSAVANNEIYGGGIGNYFEGYDVVVSNCKVLCCATTNAAGGVTGQGGGISVTPGGKVRDCLVRNCKGGSAQLAAVGRSGADYGAHRTLISGCTIEGGVCRPLYLGSSQAIQNATVENTMIRDTTLTPGSSLSGYAVYVFGSDNRILSSVVRNCKSVGTKGAHAVYVASGSNNVISNCVVELCKTGLTTTDGPSYSAAIAGNYATDIQIVDTIVQSNESYSASSLYTWHNAGTATGLVVRGCYFFANKSGNTCGIYPVDNRPHIFDHCTFANNTGGEFFRATGYGGPAANWIINACVFVNNCTAFDYPTDGGPYPVSYCNVATEGGTRTSPKTITKTCFSSGMLYVDSKNKDYRQAKGSSGIDIDSSSVMSYDWMRGGGRRKDMGNGRYTLSPVGKYGISVEHPNAVRRISGAHPDIGCFEYSHKIGFALFLR